MSVRKCFAIASLVLITTVAAPSKASADWLLTPFVGWNWGGTANLLEGDDFDDEFEQKAMFGASLAWMGAGVFGFEVDFGFSPNFFENTSGSGDFEFADSNLTTVMGNVIIGVPIGGQHGVGFRPYAVGGVGLVKSRLGSSGDLFNVDSTDWGFNVGAGAMFFFSDNVGVRGDVRYFRSLEDVEPIDDFNIGFANFRFWRGTLGVTIRF
ncbi:MAG: outer membrane beta-barrel protein [Vicinamibacterales bacterium]